MTKVQELKLAVASLPDNKYRRFRQWFLKRDWEKWDLEIEDDSKAGRLDFLVQEAADAKRKGRLRDL